LIIHRLFPLFKPIGIVARFQDIAVVSNAIPHHLDSCALGEQAHIVGEKQSISSLLL
jgi:hypothetical protein